jgi:hypothetical protein
MPVVASRRKSSQVVASRRKSAQIGHFQCPRLYLHLCPAHKSAQYFAEILSVKLPGSSNKIQSFWKFPAIFSNTISGKSAGNLPYFVKIDLQISKFLRKNIPIKDHFLLIFSDLSLKKG